MTPFFQLLLISVGKKDSLDAQLSVEEWDEVYRIAKKQAVLGVVFNAIMTLPEDQKPPRPIKVRFALVAEKIEKMNAVMTQRAAEMTGWVRDLGLESCLLKGQGVATLYPFPQTRQCGDIDLWINGDLKETLKALRSRWKIGEVYYHHAESHPYNDRLEVEFHFTPNWMNSPFKNRILQKYFSDNAASQFANYSSELGFSKPTPAFDCVFSAVHIFRHLLFEGIGIRQVMDYHFILKSSTKSDRDSAFIELRRLGLERFAAALMYVEQQFFDLDREFLVCGPNARYGEFLKTEILLAGNFGHLDTRNDKVKKNDNILRKASLRLGRLPRYMTISTSEVLWAPFFKTWQYLWKVLHRF